jgi:alkaline phosphatase D
VSLAGDRHSFQAGLVSAALPPKSFDPVGAEFVTGSISAPGLAEAAGYKIAKNDPLRPLYLWEPSPGAPPKTALNFTAMHGVRASLALQSTGDLKKALSERNPEVAPHLSFLDWGGHGYAAVRVTEDELEVEFVCVPRPIERSSAADGGPLAYRVAHRVRRWSPGEAPRVERTAVEGELPLVV